MVYEVLDIHMHLHFQQTSHGMGQNLKRGGFLNYSVIIFEKEK